MKLNHLLIPLAVVVAGVFLAGTASATYPGSTNGRVAFGMNVNGNIDIYSSLPNGKAVQRLTSDPGFDACPAYSADGKQIVFCSNQSGSFEIWTMQQNGNKQTQLTHLDAHATFPDFSPDGSKIAFDANGVNGDPNDDIYVINSDGTGLRQLTTDAGNNDYPAWSPNGSLQFRGYRSNGSPQPPAYR